MNQLTVADLIDEAAGAMRQAGVIKPRREANRLWAWQHRLNPGETWLTREQGTGPDQARAFREAVARRVRGEPLAYVLGHCGFRRLEIRCDRRALIPRPETEGLVDLALQRVRGGTALDLGTGTGCLALALADEGAFRVVGVDTSKAALSLARENRVAAGLDCDLVQSDLGSALSENRFDLVVANPPYLTLAEYQALDESVKAWEPREALVGGTDGLEQSARILRQSPGLLRPGGWIVMEVDSARSAALAHLAVTSGWDEVRIEQDLFGRDRFLAARSWSQSGGGA